MEQNTERLKEALHIVKLEDALEVIKAAQRFSESVSNKNVLRTQDALYKAIDKYTKKWGKE